nr:hypothetical protein Itr_chr01CG11110 [Ipomoea trifida]
MDVLSCYHHHRPSETRIEASQTGSNKRRLLTETCEYSRFRLLLRNTLHRRKSRT